MVLTFDKAREYLVRRVSPDERYDDLLRYPRYVEVETVNACNARCPMCTIEDWTRDSPTMKADLFRKISDDLVAHADVLKRVSLYRDGEPLLDKKLPERIAILKDGGIRQVTISSNIGLLSEKIAKALLEARLDVIIMSIDSLQKDVFESIRVRLDFDEVLTNALRFIELRNRIRPETKIWMRMIRQESNRNEWPAYEAFWKGKLSPSDRIYFHNIFNWGDQLDGFRPMAMSYEPRLPCVSLWSLLVIFANGDVPLCNVDYNNKYPTGSVLTHSIAELWQSKIMSERRQLHLDGKKECISLCGKCNVWDEPESANPFISSQYAEKVPLSA
jgi:sulfatase maturation enzyme AslB (radical SAM superfamily)